MVYCTGKWKAWKRVVFFIHRQYDNNGSTLGWRHLESLYMSPFHSKSLCWSLVLNLWVSKSFISLFSQQVVVYFFIYFQLLFLSHFMSHFESWPPNPGEWLRFNQNSGQCQIGSITLCHSRGRMREGCESDPVEHHSPLPDVPFRASYRGTSHSPIQGSSL